MAPLIREAQRFVQTTKAALPQGPVSSASLFLPEVMAASCSWLECGLAAAGYGVSVASLFFSCGATLGVGCVLALVGSRIAAISLVLACDECLS